MQDQAAAIAQGHGSVGGTQGPQVRGLDLVVVTLTFSLGTFSEFTHSVDFFVYVLIHNENVLEQKSVVVAEC